MKTKMERMEMEFQAKKKNYEEQEVYRNKLMNLKWAGLIEYKNVAKEVGVSNGFVSHFTTGRSNFGPAKFAKLKKYVDDIEAAADAVEAKHR